jgi:hypothetical protein
LTVGLLVAYRLNELVVRRTEIIPIDWAEDEFISLSTLYQFPYGVCYRLGFHGCQFQRDHFSTFSERGIRLSYSPDRSFT